MDNTITQRLVSLDVFRGMTIAGMVLVNNPGTSPVYWPLEHADWNGLTPTDWIFPFFLFIVGVAVPIALSKRVTQGITRPVYIKIVVRAASIYLLGAAISILPFFQFTSTDAPEIIKLTVWLLLAAALLFLLLRKFRLAAVLTGVGLLGIGAMNLAGYNVVPYNFGALRVFGVLQRISVVYLAISLLYLHTTWKQQVGISGVLLMLYWLIMTVIPVPGCDVTTINDKACNLAAYLDRIILTENHIWRAGKVYDPEGILSTVPAVVTCISGVLTGTWLRSSRPAAEKVSGMFFFGVVLLATGFIWNGYFPMNKALWTSSYVLATSGLALLVLASCYWLIDIQGYRRWATPFVVFGANALALFVFTGIFARMISSYKVAGADGQHISVQRWVMNNVFLQIAPPIDASLLFALSFILLWLLLMWILYRRNIYIKV